MRGVYKVHYNIEQRRRRRLVVNGRDIPFWERNLAQINPRFAAAVGLGPPIPVGTNPAPGILIPAGTNIQSVVNANPAGSQFVLGNGTHFGQSIVSKNGNQYRAQTPGSVIMDGQNSTSRAFTGSATGGLIDGIIVQNYSVVRFGAIHVQSGWEITNCEPRENVGAGIEHSANCWIHDNWIHHNRQTGIIGNTANGSVVEDNEISFNNYLGLADPGYEAGGSKWVLCDGLTLRNNYVHDNREMGLWCDFNNINIIYEDNLVEDHIQNGIFHEISYAAIIRNNTVRRNGVGIRYTSSRDVEIHNNIVEAVGSNRGIYASDSVRGTGNNGEWRIVNNWVHHNDVTVDQGYSGLWDNHGTGAVWNTANNEWDFNDYHVNNANPFIWEGNDTKTWAEWQGYGNDLNGSID